ncbi:MAG: DUF421 domain-containing protein [Alphaproteobacteria bacterium]|nr:DUF421 domain-containing protein [Alphaproteobacteria bacterium]
MWFDDWNALLDVGIRGVVCFIGLVVLLRMGGKRTLTKMNAFDFIMTYTIGSTLASVLTSETLTISEGITALAVIIGVQYVIAWCEVRSDWFQKIIKSQPSVLYADNDYQIKTMRKERISRVEVLAAMRYSGFLDPSQVEYVILETDGQLSVLPKQKEVDDQRVMQTVRAYKNALDQT